MGIETTIFIIAAIGGGILIALPLIFSQNTVTICPLEPCTQNFTAIFNLDSIEETMEFLDQKETITITKNCSTLNGTTETKPCSYDQNYTIATTNNKVFPIDVNQNAISIMPLNNQIDLIIPDPLKSFADANSIFEANCWITKNGQTLLSLPSPKKPNTVLTNTVFNFSTRLYACSELREIQ